VTVVATPPAPKLELPPLKLGPITVDTPVILAPMAGITNSAFRRLCREYGGGLYVAEMVTSRALVERTPESLRIELDSGDYDGRRPGAPRGSHGPRRSGPGRDSDRRHDEHRPARERRSYAR